MGPPERDLADPWIRALRSELTAGHHGDVDNVLANLLSATERAARDGSRAAELQIDVLHEIAAAIEATGEQPDAARAVDEIERYQGALFERVTRDRMREKRALAARKEVRMREERLRQRPPRARAPTIKQRVLGALIEPARPRDIATTLDLDPEVVSRALRDLQEQGDVRRVPEFERMDSDHRARWYVRVVDERDF